MSCNGCRVLRKGCGDSCILRPCLQWIDTPEAQGHATLFVAKFFGRAGLISFISAVPDNQRPSLFQSLLFEAAGRTVNPVNGAVGLLWSGNWHVCQAAVETVLHGGTLRPIPELLREDTLGNNVFMAPLHGSTSDNVSEAEVACTHMGTLQDPDSNRKQTHSRSPTLVMSPNRKKLEEPMKLQAGNLDLQLTPNFLGKTPRLESLRPGTPSMNSDESATTCSGSGLEERKLLNLFV